MKNPKTYLLGFIIALVLAIIAYLIRSRSDTKGSLTAN
jgi:heme/copper-type cytochrome/quinol oxidase subunit 4